MRDIFVVNNIADNTKRNSNIELLRIFAMFIIVFHHFCVHGIFNFWSLNTEVVYHINNFIAELFSIGGKIGVDIFVIITGYFMIKSKFNLRSLLNIYLKTLFYSIFFLIITLVIGHWIGYPVSTKMIIKSLTPFFSNAYWFISAYLILYMLIPLINYFIKKVPKKTFDMVFLVSSIIVVGLQTIFPKSHICGSFFYFIYLYVLGACISINYYKVLSDRKLLSLLTIFSMIFLCTHFLLTLSKPDVNLWKAVKYVKCNSFFAVIPALFLFNFFSNLKIRYNNKINWISQSMIGVYLIHDNNFVRPFLWTYLFHPADFMYSKYFILYALFIPPLVFVLCIIADKCMRLFYEKPIKFIIDRISMLADKVKSKNNTKFLKYFSQVQ